MQQEVAHLCSLNEIRSAFTWFRAQEPQFAQWQLELARIAAPPFGESARGKWLADKFCELGLESVHTDEVGNVFGTHAGYGHGHVSLSAHLDTVFPAGTPLNIQQQGSRLYGPGVSDNGAGVTAMLAMVAALRALGIRHALPLLFIGNVVIRHVLRKWIAYPVDVIDVDPTCLLIRKIAFCSAIVFPTQLN